MVIFVSWRHDSFTVSRHGSDPWRIVIWQLSVWDVTLLINQLHGFVAMSEEKLNSVRGSFCLFMKNYGWLFSKINILPLGIIYKSKKCAIL
jgi:hypothetical protein